MANDKDIIKAHETTIKELRAKLAAIRQKDYDTMAAIREWDRKYL